MPDDKSKPEPTNSSPDAKGPNDLFDLTLEVTLSVSNLRRQIDAIHRAQRRLMKHSPDFDDLERVLSLLEYLENSIRTSQAANE